MKTLTELLPQMRHDASVAALHHNEKLFLAEGRKPGEAQALALWAADRALKRERAELQSLPAAK
ncbi:MAG: hypothetical protein NTY01_00270 [Verrucomicrobia bacterium]|nr:hypothetical protein [Verrucomicrobiota bacterium]